MLNKNFVITRLVLGILVSSHKALVFDIDL